MVAIRLIPREEFQRVDAAAIGKHQKIALLADMCRVNTLATVKRAGSGHLGSSFSSLDIVTALYYSEMNTVRLGLHHPDRDIYFSSKGHDAPGLYAVLFSLGILPKDKFVRLRRLGGTFGHPDVTTPGIEANSGSLGMGISKGKGIALAKSVRRQGGRVFVMTGDGELQEGQIYEALQSAAHQKIGNLIVIVDHNKVQSDAPVSEICDLGNLNAKFEAFGWHVARSNGHDLQELEDVFREFRRVTDRPKILIADTIKGKGVSFMEHPAALKTGKGLYRWHSGAPDDHAFAAAFDEIMEGINNRLTNLRMPPLMIDEILPEQKPVSSVSAEYVADVFGQALVELAAERDDLVVLDADLTADCRLRGFAQKYPHRFIQNGIAEQDMVSMAGGLALQGLLPVVNTFANFLAGRANEQIYNNACEQTKIIYCCHYAGLIPAGPGQSHQSVRDVSLLAGLPNCVIVQPCNAMETRLALRHCVNEAKQNCVLRLAIGPSPRVITLPLDYRLIEGCGVELTDGKDAILFAYGPVMLHEALLGAGILKAAGFGLKVINMPWLNRIDLEWLKLAMGSCPRVYVLEDHFPVGGLGDTLLNGMVDAGLLQNRSFKKFAIDDYPACGTPQEVLQSHGLDGANLARRIRADA
jgi:transketolase